MRSLSRRSALLPLLIAPVLLAGCSSEEEGNASASADTSSSAPSSSAAAGSSTASSSASSTGSAGDSEAAKKETFCTTVPDVLNGVTENMGSVSADPQQAPALLTQAVDQLTAVQPPADVAPQWQRFVTAVTSMRDLVAQADLTNPAANADLAPQVQALQTELIDAGTAVDDYGKANC